MKIGEVLKQYQWATKKSVRELAKEIGVSHPTLNRIQRGENMDGKTLAQIISWLLSDLKP